MSHKVTTSACPDDELLGQYVTGELSSRDAAHLDAHLGKCPICQKKIDEYAAQPDSLLAGVRAEKQERVSRFDSVLARVADQNPGKDKSRKSGSLDDSGRIDEPMTVDAFVRCLRKSRLLKGIEIDQLLKLIEPPDTDTFVRELVGRRKLTPFQASALKRGRYKGLMLGNYIVLDKLGSGGMGNVFKARHVRMGRLVCIKVLRSSRKKSADVVTRFRREAKTIAALNHPNFVVAHDADEADGIPFLVMEYIAGQDLAKHVRKMGPVAPKQAVDIVLDVALALAHAHRVGIIHRDIKPHNLLLGIPVHDPDFAEEDSGKFDLVDDGFVKILDMGLARFDSFVDVGSDSTQRGSMTASGIVMGTVDYISPEQALNSRHADERSDVYSLGCTLFFLLTGRTVYTGETIMEKLLAHREDPVPNLQRKVHGVSRGLNAVFQKMLAKNPADRYQNMTHLANDLRAVKGGGKPTALNDRLLQKLLSYRIVRFGLVLLAAILSFGVAGAAGWYLVQFMAEPPSIISGEADE